MLSDYLVTQTLKQFFHGHEDEFAARLNVPRHKFGRWIGRIKEGKGCPSLVNLTLELLANNPQILMDLAEQYRESLDGSELYPRTCAFSGDMAHAMAEFSDRSKCVSHEQRVEQLNHCGREFIRAIEYVFCGRNADHFAACKLYCINNPGERQRNQRRETRPCDMVMKLTKLLSSGALCPAEAKRMKRK